MSEASLQPGNGQVDEVQITATVTSILMEAFGVPAHQLPRDADLVRDLGADEADLIEIDDAIENVFHLPGFDAAWDLANGGRVCVGDLVDSVVDVLAHVPAEGPGR